jgi:hypothetical protein
MSILSEEEEEKQDERGDNPDEQQSTNFSNTAALDIVDSVIAHNTDDTVVSANAVDTAADVITSEDEIMIGLFKRDNKGNLVIFDEKIHPSNDESIRARTKEERQTIMTYVLMRRDIASNEDWLDGMLDIQKEATKQMRLDMHYFLNSGVSSGSRRIGCLDHLIDNWSMHDDPPKKKLPRQSDWIV